MSKRIHSRDVRKAAIDLLEERGVDLKEIAEIVYDMQSPYAPDLTLELCLESVEAVLEKREMQHAILVGIELDKLAEQKKLSWPLQEIVEQDEGLFGIDETLAIGASFVYGSIAVTTYGHLDKAKSGVIKRLDTKNGDAGVHTFLDDLVASVAANASSRLAHRLRDEEERTTGESRNNIDDFFR